MLREPLVGVDDSAAKLKSWQSTIFLITFVNYAMAHWTRKVRARRRQY